MLKQMISKSVSSMRRTVVGAVFLILATGAAFADIVIKDYLPTVGGVMRTRFEIETQSALNRFAVNNARVWLRGNAMPRLSYFVCADLCNQGQFQFLDAYGRFDIGHGLAVQAGQFRIPFGVDPFRGPGGYVFADRSFIGRDIDNIRAVGAQASYTFQGNVPAAFTLGLFSPNAITNHNRWNKSFNAALKAELPVGPLKFTAGIQTIKPDNIRANMADACLYFAIGRWRAEAEWMFKHYLTHDLDDAPTGAFNDVHAWNVWADYSIPLKKTIFDRLSFQARFDANSAHTSTANYEIDFPARKRITLGATLGYVKTPVKCEIQLNYEKYFYEKGAEIPTGRNDKVVAELIISF